MMMCEELPCLERSQLLALFRRAAPAIAASYYGRMAEQHSGEGSYCHHLLLKLAVSIWLATGA